tara:strand:- start:3279 stop:3506 length:228 start_codon:yes stop_codon:yes gene_type:complete
MFKPEDFELPLEASFKLRKVNDEIDNCRDLDQLKENLKGSVQLMMRYQHIIQRILLEQITKELNIGLEEINNPPS